MAANGKSWERQSYKLAGKNSVFLRAGKREKGKKKRKEKPSRNGSSDSYRQLETKTTAPQSLCTVNFLGHSPPVFVSIETKPEVFFQFLYLKKNPNKPKNKGQRRALCPALGGQPAAHSSPEQAQPPSELHWSHWRPPGRVQPRDSLRSSPQNPVSRPLAAARFLLPGQRRLSTLVPVSPGFTPLIPDFPTVTRTLLDTPQGSCS